jgi:predicted ATPase
MRYRRHKRPAVAGVHERKQLGAYMRWGIHDFKGLAHAEIDLSPGVLTVLTGVNSSGKSSAIQSVLMAAQSQYHNGPVVLNGTLVRLGEASDLIRSPAVRRPVRIELIGTEEDSLADGVRIIMGLVPSKDDAYLEVSQLEISTEGLAPNDSRVRLSKEYSRTDDITIVAEALTDSTATDILHLKSALAPERRLLRTYVGMRGLVPVSMVQVSNADDIEKQYTKAVTSVLDESVMNPTGSPGPRVVGSDFAVGQVIQEFVHLIETGIEEAPTVLAEALLTLRVARNGNPYRFEASWRVLDEKDRESAIALAASVRSRTPYVKMPLVSRYQAHRFGVLELKLRSTLEDTQIALHELGKALESIASRVQYLGPLRDEPRVVWNQWNELTRGLPVGTRGEFSAVVLSRVGSSPIRYVSSAGEEKTGPLSAAVDDWLAYLDIGDQVNATSLGKLGIGMKVKVAGAERDLTAVGVGVSQALPLVVGVLACPPKSIFIVEQPELHLHPAVQSRLADFLTNARPDLSIVVETHSDSLVTRLRRRVAEGGLSADRVKIAFVEQGDEGSISRNLLISEYGDLSDWPAGFLSDIEEDTRAIVQANMQRIRRNGQQ